MNDTSAAGGVAREIRQRCGPNYQRLIEALAVLAFGTPLERETFFGEPVYVNARVCAPAPAIWQDGRVGRPCRTHPDVSRRSFDAEHTSGAAREPVEIHRERREGPSRPAAAGAAAGASEAESLRGAAPAPGRSGAAPAVVDAAEILRTIHAQRRAERISSAWPT